MTRNEAATALAATLGTASTFAFVAFCGSLWSDSIATVAACLVVWRLFRCGQKAAESMID